MVEDGQCVVVHLVITLVDDETVVETTDSNVATPRTDDQHRDRPHEFVGEGDVARALEDAVRGLEPGETRRVTVEPGSASPSGPWREEAVVGLARDLLNARNDIGSEPGTLVFSTRGVDGWTTVTGEGARLGRLRPRTRRRTPRLRGGATRSARRRNGPRVTAIFTALGFESLPKNKIASQTSTINTIEAR
jgi:FKBP-type peptidyl-prolyl cis-trans isomerase 2